MGEERKGNRKEMDVPGLMIENDSGHDVMTS